MATSVLACVNSVGLDPVVHRTSRDAQCGSNLAYPALMWLSDGYYTVAGYLNAHCDSVHTRPLYLGVEGYEDPSTRAFSSCQPTFGDPVVDGGATDFQLAGE
ncbi:hypothetical protein, partial [Ferrimicrobium acidiphilum]|uniref:hypothetical protein n=1 Tax=Ferrimicrobium acidiphilum TaxID=121039 RepID=UPI0023F1DEC9